MRKILTAAVLLASLAGAATAHAQVSGGIIVSNGYHGRAHYSGGVFVQQPPVVYYGQPAPVYYARPVVAPPPPVYYPRPYYYHDRWGYYHHEYHHHHHGWR